jgi:hypothetical protein
MVVVDKVDVDDVSEDMDSVDGWLLLSSVYSDRIGNTNMKNTNEYRDCLSVCVCVLVCVCVVVVVVVVVVEIVSLCTHSLSCISSFSLSLSLSLSPSLFLSLSRM